MDSQPIDINAQSIKYRRVPPSQIKRDSVRAKKRSDLHAGNYDPPAQPPEGSPRGADTAKTINTAVPIRQQGG